MWQDLCCGEIIKIVRNENFPADLLCLKSNDKKKGTCYIETKNLDGETNLKRKLCPKELNCYELKELGEGKMKFEYQ